MRDIDFIFYLKDLPTDKTLGEFTRPYPTMTGLLDGLEKDGRVERLAHRQDRRKIGVRLTVKGRQVLDEMLPGYYRNIAKFMVNLTEKERLELMSLLGKVNRGLSSLFKA